MPSNGAKRSWKNFKRTSATISCLREYREAAHGAKLDESDIDFVAIFEMLDANIIRQYREIVATMEQSDLACDSSAAERLWPHGRATNCSSSSTTKALHGSLDIVETPTKTKRVRLPRPVQRASITPLAIFARSARCKAPIRLRCDKALFKTQFAMQAHCFAQGSNYPRSYRV
ncbi:MAG: hypothetical protein ACLTQI_00815 [Slackia sp.]